MELLDKLIKLNKYYDIEELLLDNSGLEQAITEWILEYYPELGDDDND